MYGYNLFKSHVYMYPNTEYQSRTDYISSPSWIGKLCNTMSEFGHDTHVTLTNLRSMRSCEKISHSSEKPECQVY